MYQIVSKLLKAHQKLLQEAFDDGILRKVQIREWCKRFKRDQEKLPNNELRARPSTSGLLILHKNLDCGFSEKATTSPNRMIIIKLETKVLSGEMFLRSHLLTL